MFSAILAITADIILVMDWFFLWDVMIISFTSTFILLQSSPKLALAVEKLRRRTGEFNYVFVYNLAVF